jgi:dihydrofolate reductase
MTLDGIMEAPEIWAANYIKDQEITEDILNDFSASDTFLFGRTTFEFMGERWPKRTGAMADSFNNNVKYVVSDSLQKTEWNNSIIIKGNIIEEIKRLKEKPGKNIIVLGSYKLAQLLDKEKLVDEYRLTIYPLTLGKGKRLFEEGSAEHSFKLIDARTFTSGAIRAVYQPV